jgi:hypothetical protein
LAVCCALILGVSLAGPVAAAPPKLAPEKAEELRGAVRTKAGGAGPAAAQVDVLFRSGQQLGDPVLILDGADMQYGIADEARSIDQARVGLEQVAIALDIVFYLAEGDHFDDTTWHPVARESLAEIQGRSEGLRTRLEDLIAEIEAELAAAAAAANAPPPVEPKGPRPGTGAIAGGSVALALGLGGVTVMALGLVRGADIQGQVEDLDLPAQLPEYERLDAQGKRANIMSWVGGAIGAVGLGVGIGLIAVGVKKRRAGGDVEAEPQVSLMPTLRGAVLEGRF